MITAMLRVLVKTVLAMRYRTRVKGLDELDGDRRSVILFLPNHPALIDPIVIMSVLHKRFAPRSLADENQIDRFFIRTLARRAGAIPTPDLVASGPGARQQVREALEACVDVLRGGENLLLYPSGHAYHTRWEDLRGNSAVRYILDELPDVRVVLVRQRGLWGSRFSRAFGHEPDVAATVRRALWVLPVNLFALMPKREISIELVEPDDLPRQAPRREINKYLEAFYNEDAPPATTVADFFWQSHQPRIVPEPSRPRVTGDVENVPSDTRRIVREHLRDVTGQEQIDWDDQLAADLGLDSLARAELLVWLQGEFGFAGGDVDALRTVGDLALAASGSTPLGRKVDVSPPPRNWAPRGPRKPLNIPDGETLNEVIVAAAQADPSSPLIADQRSDVKTARDVMTAAFALGPLLSDLPGTCLGIMLPASVGAASIYTAALLAGKTPVMVNWTVGAGNLKHCLDLAAAQKVVTARALLDRLRGQGVDLSSVEERLVCIEDLAGSLSKWDKLKAAAAARFRPRTLLDTQPPDIAAVLFTSGSEAKPKAVPLSHRNMLSNIRDLPRVVSLYNDDRMLAMLPPFHAFGLTVNIGVPLCMHLPAVYHPDPMQSQVLAKLIEAWRATLLVGTPTFLQGIVRSADSPLPSLRIAVTGAEKAPQRLYDQLADTCPSAVILEGYGVTECSPIVAVNDENDPRPGTIGKPLPGFEHLIVDPETRRPVSPGNRGMLLVRGPSVFDGYLGDEAPDPFVEAEGKTWYSTGDLVTEDDDGVLTFKGRWKRFVKIGGEMISLPAIESVLSDAFESGDEEAPTLAVIGHGPEGNTQLVLFTTRELTRQQVNDAIRSAGLSGLHNIRRVEQIDELPQLGTGKVDYRSLQRRLES